MSLPESEDAGLPFEAAVTFVSPPDRAANLGVTALKHEALGTLVALSGGVDGHWMSGEKSAGVLTPEAARVNVGRR